ncbi:DUF6491 family protein [Brevundimonas sp. NPDC092305]|uniref:DUF6491 family protein n=1 Tax=Brevundimonas sp. NPDC092305 TaxID=3363957 RepID=UPI0038197201
MRTMTLATAAIASLAAGCAPTADTPAVQTAASERQCFNVDFIRNFRQSPPSIVYVRAGRDDVFQLNASGGCFDLDYANSLAITPDIGAVGGSRLCTGDWARIAVPGRPDVPNVCRARIEKKLTAEEIAALPSRERP